MIDLEDKYLQEVMRILADQVPDYNVWAYGSRVTGGAGEFSDLDLVLVGDQQIDWQRIESLKDAFSASGLPITVDVLDWQSIPESFRDIILKNHKVLQKAGN